MHLRVSFVAVLLALVGLSPPPASAQAQRGEIHLPPLASAEERTRQGDLWVLEVYFKPLRMIPVELTDPQTSEKTTRFVWYVAYRAVNRQIEQRGDANQPVNPLDPPVRPPTFVPEFTLVTDDNGVQKIYHDQILPEAEAEIAKRERMRYRNSVEVVGPIPPPTPEGERPRGVIAGVAIWQGIDPAADNFTLYMTGFSNGYQIVKGPDGNNFVETKTVMQKFWRPGDQFDLREPEIRLGAVASGRAQGGALDTITLDEDSSSRNGYYTNSSIRIDNGVGAGQMRLITAYDGTTKVATVDSPWERAPDATSHYTIKGHDKPRWIYR